MDDSKPLMHVQWQRLFEQWRHALTQPIEINVEQIIGGGQPLTRANDTNVTLTLTGTPATALLKPVLITAGWTGVLSVARGGTGTGTAFTAGSVVFAGASGIYAQDNAHFFWDDTNNRLGIGTATPANTVSVTGDMAVTGASMGLIGSAGSENIFVFNSAVGASTFVARTNGTVEVNGLGSDPNHIGLSVNVPAGGVYTPFAVNGSSAGDIFIVAQTGRVGIGVITPLANLHIKAGTTAASTAPLKFTSGSLLTSPEAGAVEFLTDAFYGTSTTGPTRRRFAQVPGTAYVIGDLLYADTTTTLALRAIGSTGDVLTVTGGLPVWAAMSGLGTGDLTRVNDTNVTVTLGGTPVGSLFKSVSLTLGWSGTLSAARGGTGTGTYAVGDLLYADTTTTLARLADVSVGSYLRSGGVTTAPLWSTLKLPNAATTGDLFFASASNTMSALADVAVGSYLRSGGVTTAPLWSTLTLPNAATTGDLLFASASNTISVLADVAVGSYLRSGGVTTAPLWSTLVLPNAANSGDILKASGSNTYASVAPGALTKTDDTNVTATLGGSATTALVNAASITLGWTGTLALTRGGLGFDASGVAKGGLFVGTAAATVAVKTVGTDGQVLTADAASTGGVKWNSGAGYTGTANQVIITGLVFSTPQSIGTGNSPQFASIGLGTAAVSQHFIEASGSLNGALVGLKETNTSNAGSAFASIQLANDTGNLFAFFLNGSGNTAYGGAQGITFDQVGNFPMSFATSDLVRWGINGAGDWTFGASGHIADSNGTPTISSGFGVSPTIAGTDYGFIVTIGSTANTGGVVNLGHTFTNAPVCACNAGGVFATSIATSTTQVTIAYTSAVLTNVKLYVLCRGY